MSSNLTKKFNKNKNKSIKLKAKLKMYNHRHYGATAYPEFDRNRDGRITESDFILAARQNGTGYYGEAVNRATFRALDLDRNGVLDNYEASRGFHASHRSMNRYC